VTTVIAVLNQKGGTAKTTTVVTLASKFALMGKKVLIIDVDPQGNASIGLGVDINALEKSMFDVLVRKTPLDDVIVSTYDDRLHLAPGHVDLSKTDVNLADEDFRQFRLKAAIQAVGNRYDYIFVDCPPSLGLIPVNALVAATSVIIPVVPQYYSLEGLKQVINSIESVKVALNSKIEILGILFCMVNSRPKLTQTTIDLVRGHFGNQVFNTLIHISSKFNEASLLQESLFEFDPHSKVAKEYASVAEEIIERTSDAGFMKRFTLSSVEDYFTNRTNRILEDPPVLDPI